MKIVTAGQQKVTVVTGEIERTDRFAVNVDTTESDLARMAPHDQSHPQLRGIDCQQQQYDCNKGRLKLHRISRAL